MPTVLLIRTNGVMPPGGYAYRDPKTGKHYVDMHTNFKTRVTEIIRDRKANPGIYPATAIVEFDYDYVARQLSEYNCMRLGNDPRYCISDTQPMPSAPEVLTLTGKKCVCGSTEWLPNYCKTCGGKRLKGYICAQCGAKISK